MSQYCSALCVNCCSTNQALREIHQPPVIGIGCIELHHREFGIVTRANTFIAEVAIDFKDALKATNY